MSRPAESPVHSKSVAARRAIFDELRAAMRLSSKSAGDDEPDLCAEDVAAELCDIRQALHTLERSLRQRRPAPGTR